MMTGNTSAVRRLPSDLMRPRYCRSADARMRMKNALLLPRAKLAPWGLDKSLKLNCTGDEFPIEHVWSLQQHSPHE